MLIFVLLVISCGVCAQTQTQPSLRQRRRCVPPHVTPPLRIGKSLGSTFQTSAAACMQYCCNIDAYIAYSFAASMLGAPVIVPAYFYVAGTQLDGENLRPTHGSDGYLAYVSSTQSNNSF